MQNVYTGSISSHQVHSFHVFGGPKCRETRSAGSSQNLLGIQKEKEKRRKERFNVRGGCHTSRASLESPRGCCFIQSDKQKQLREGPGGKGRRKQAQPRFSQTACERRPTGVLTLGCSFQITSLPLTSPARSQRIILTISHFFYYFHSDLVKTISNCSLIWLRLGYSFHAHVLLKSSLLFLFFFLCGFVI